MNFKSVYFTELLVTGFYWLPGFSIKSSEHASLWLKVALLKIKSKVKFKINHASMNGYN